MTIKLPTPGHTMKKSLQKAGKIVGIACVVFVSIESTLTWIIHQQHQQLPPYTSTAATRRLRKLPVEEIGSISTSSSKQFQATYSDNRPQTVREKQSPAKNAVYPNVLYVGAQKAGTSAVSEWLFLQKENGHGVCHAKLIGNEPSYTPKEVHHFDDPERFEKGKGFYAEHFKHCHDASLVIDATPNYLSLADRIHEFYKETVKNKSLLKDLKIMVSLRDPVARELSLYNQMLWGFLNKRNSPGCWHAEVTKNGKILSFDEYVDQVLIPKLSDPDNTWRFSRYAQYLKEWFELFDRDQILVLSYEEIKNNIDLTKWRVKQFLNHTEFSGVVAEQNQKLFAQKVHVMSCKAQKKLHNLFEPLNQDLYDLLEKYQGPEMEEYPFPKFKLPKCE